MFNNSVFAKGRREEWMSLEGLTVIHPALVDAKAALEKGDSKKALECVMTALAVTSRLYVRTQPTPSQPPGYPNGIIEGETGD